MSHIICVIHFCSIKMHCVVGKHVHTPTARNDTELRSDNMKVLPEGLNLYKFAYHSGSSCSGSFLPCVSCVAVCPFPDTWSSCTVMFKSAKGQKIGDGVLLFCSFCLVFARLHFLTRGRP